MGFAFQKYILSVKDQRTGEPITSGVYTFVYQAGTKTLDTLYSTSNGLAKTNPIARASFTGTLSFYTAQTSVDIFVADDKGNTALFTGITPTDHVLSLDRSGVDKCMVAPFVFNAGGTETDTGLDFPLNAYIHDFLVEVVTTDATETLGIGLLSSETAGDADGIAVAVSTANAGFIRSYVVTDGTNEDFVATPYKGALMGLGSAGTDVANDFGQSGGPGHVVTGSNAKSLVYLPSSSDTMAGYIHVFFKQLR